MNFKERKRHWEDIYTTRPLETVSWYQPVPETSLDFFSSLRIPTDAPVIDVGGGDSLLADHLLDLGYTDISVLDISGTAISRAKERLGDRASRVHWIEADATTFTPNRLYSVWHDRAVFHFLTQPQQRTDYLNNVSEGLKNEGYLIVGTFSDQGPLKCSGLDVQRYSIAELQQEMSPWFKPFRCLNVGHKTPSGGIQDFTFCAFTRI